MIWRYSPSCDSTFDVLTAACAWYHKTTNAGCNTPKKESPKGTKQTKEVSNKKVKTNNYEEVTSADWKKMIEELRNLSDESKDGKKKR